MTEPTTTAVKETIDYDNLEEQIKKEEEERKRKEAVRQFNFSRDKQGSAQCSVL